jgi:hypothetical protein
MSQGKAFSFAGNVNSGVDCNGPTIFIVKAHRDNGKRFVVRADERLTAFAELKSAILACRELT